MFDRLTAYSTPYIWFAIAGVLFLVVGALAQAVLPMATALIVAEVGSLLGFSLFMRHHWDAPEPMGWPSVRHTGGGWWTIPVLFVSGGVFGLCANAFGSLIAALVPGMAEQAQRYAETIQKLLNTGDPLLDATALVSIIVFAPLCEEALFRGTLLPVQREQEPTVLAIGLNGVLFSLLHLSALNFVPLALLGAAMAWVTWRTRSIWPAIACHIGVNTFNGLLIPKLGEYLGVSTEVVIPPVAEVLQTLAILVPLTGLVLWGVHRLLPHAKDPES